MHFASIMSNVDHYIVIRTYSAVYLSSLSKYVLSTTSYIIYRRLRHDPETSVQIL